MSIELWFGLYDIIGISIVFVIIFWYIKIHYLNLSLGASRGILCSFILIGIILILITVIFSYGTDALSLFRNSVLMLFFVGSGSTSGIKFIWIFNWNWFLYGAV